MSTLRRLRQDAGLTQMQLADACHLSQSYISDLERGRGNLTRQSARRVSQALADPLNRPARDIAGELVMAPDASPLHETSEEHCTQTEEAA